MRPSPKAELAMAMVAAARARGSTHCWVGADEVYGNSLAFTDGLGDLGEICLVDVACKTKVWTSDPCAPAPAKGAGLRNGACQPATPEASGGAAVRVDRLTAARCAEQALTVTIRAASKCPRGARVGVLGLRMG